MTPEKFQSEKTISHTLQYHSDTIQPSSFSQISQQTATSIMKKILLLMLMFLMSTILLAQQRSKNPYKAVDGETYNVGDVLKFNAPTNNGLFQSVLYTERISAADVSGTILRVMGGSTAPPPKTVQTQYADVNVKDFSGKILFFRKEKVGNTEMTFAYIPFQTEVFLKVAIDAALPLGEVTSKNKNFVTVQSVDNKAEDNFVQSAFDHLKFEIVGAYGNSTNRTVTFEYTVYNNSDLSQIVGIDDNGTNTGGYATMTDFDGNTYTSIHGQLGNKEAAFFRFETEIPTKVKLKGRVTFGNVLNNVSKLSVINIKTSSRNAVGESNVNYGNTSFRNIPIIWENNATTKQASGNNYDLKLYNKDLTLEITSVNGNSKTQKVNIEYVMQNNGNNAKMCVDKPFATDAAGNMYQSSKTKLGQNNNCSLLPTGIKIKGFIEISGVPSSVDKIEYFNIPFDAEVNNSKVNGANEIRNLMIVWK